MELLMKLALDEARRSASAGGIPIGAVLVGPGGEVLGRGHNRRVQDDDPIMHAEIHCLRNAGRIRSYRGTTLYSTLMPCYLCAGAAVQFGIEEVVVGESRNFPGARGFLEANGVRVTDLDLDECAELLAGFISEHPDVWNEDISSG